MQVAPPSAAALLLQIATFGGILLQFTQGNVGDGQWKQGFNKGSQLWHLQTSGAGDGISLSPLTLFSSLIWCVLVEKKKENSQSLAVLSRVF